MCLRCARTRGGPVVANTPRIRAGSAVPFFYVSSSPLPTELGDADGILFQLVWGGFDVPTVARSTKSSCGSNIAPRWTGVVGSLMI